MIVDTKIGQIEIDDSERTTCEVWTRVMGYYRPVQEFNIGKKQEHQDRIFFSEKTVMEKELNVPVYPQNVSKL